MLQVNIFKKSTQSDKEFAPPTEGGGMVILNVAILWDGLFLQKRKPLFLKFYLNHDR